MANLAGGAVSGNGSVRYFIRSAALTPIARQDELGGYSVEKLEPPSRAHARKSVDFCGFQAIGARTEMASHITSVQYPPAPYLSLTDATAITKAALYAATQWPRWRCATVTWSKINSPWPPADNLKTIMDNLRHWLKARGCPVLWLWVAECGSEFGLHHHILFAMPDNTTGDDVREAFERWLSAAPICARKPHNNLEGGAYHSRKTTVIGFLRYTLKTMDPHDLDRLLRNVGLSRIEAIEFAAPAGHIDGRRIGVAGALGPKAQASTAAPICTTTATFDPETGEILDTATGPAADVRLGRDLEGEITVPRAEWDGWQHGRAPASIRAAFRRLKKARGDISTDAIAAWLGVAQCHVVTAISSETGRHDPLSDSVAADLKRWMERGPTTPPKRRASAPRKARQHGNTTAPLFDRLAA